MNEIVDRAERSSDEFGMRERLHEAAGLRWHDGSDIADQLWAQAQRERRRRSWGLGVGTAAAVAAGAVVISQLAGGTDAPPRPQPAPQPSISTDAPTGSAEPTGTSPTTGSTTTGEAAPVSLGIPPGGVVLRFERVEAARGDADPGSDFTPFLGSWRLLPDLAEPQGTVAGTTGISEAVTLGVYDGVRSDEGALLTFELGSCGGGASGKHATIDDSGRVAVEEGFASGRCMPEADLLMDVLRSGQMTLSADGDALTASLPATVAYAPADLGSPVSDGTTAVPVHDGVWAVLPAGWSLPAPTGDCLLDAIEGCAISVESPPMSEPLSIDPYRDMPEAEGHNHVACPRDWGIIDSTPELQTRTIDGVEFRGALWTATCHDGSTIHPQEWYAPELDLSFVARFGNDDLDAIVSSLQLRDTPVTTTVYGQATHVGADSITVSASEGSDGTYTLTSQTRCPNLAHPSEHPCGDLLSQLYGLVDTGNAGVLLEADPDGNVVTMNHLSEGG